MARFRGNRYSGDAKIIGYGSGVVTPEDLEPDDIIPEPEPYSGPTYSDEELLAQCEAIWEATRAHRLAELQQRRTQPLLRLWDAEWNLQHVLGNERKAQFSWISNDTGPGQLELPFEAVAAQWVHDHQGRIDREEGRNVFITVDYCGSRWGGIMDKYHIEQREDGDLVLVIDFNHDYEHLKWITVWSNPFTRPAFQFPRAFMLAGPIPWILKVTLLLQLIRFHNSMITLPDDPLDFEAWSGRMDMSDWPMVVKPGSFINAMKSGALWGIVFSRWTNFHDMSHQMLEDAELSVRCDRWLTGDDPPWEGASLRNGCLVVDIVDKSGIYVGTSNGGKIGSGLVRTFVNFRDDFIDSTEDLAKDVETPTDYRRSGYKFTHPAKPYCVYLSGPSSTIQTSQWINSPAKGVTIACGGHSMPGVNETISATVQLMGDLVGNLIMVSSLGATIDAMVKPLYEDVILAWWSVFVPKRARDSGWDRLQEYFQTGANKAFTIAAAMVLRAGMWSTRTVISWKATVRNGSPFMIGDAGGFSTERGKGHYFLDDRVGLVLPGDDQIHMDRARKIDLAWDEDNPPEFEISIGDERIWQDPAQKAWGQIEAIHAGMRDLGVW